jgi:hypothetical protein
MVDDNLVATIGAEGRLDSGGYCAARIDIAKDSSIFRVIAKDRVSKCIVIYGGK